eukprot:scaffold4678_cov242-Pinguiococcus_pyrenoidosus.AAC.3
MLQAAPRLPKFGHGRLGRLLTGLCLRLCCCSALQSSAKATAPPSFDMLVIGAGAAGLMAAGTAASLGASTLLVEQRPHLGGDCSNSACVPSKAVRCAARQASPSFLAAEEHARQAVEAIRAREDLSAMREVPNLTVEVGSAAFEDRHTVRILRNDGSSMLAKGRRVIVATGADPVLPEALRAAAERAKVPLLTYRDVYAFAESTTSGMSIWTQAPRKVVVAGGGPAGLEMAQALARLGARVTLVAPKLLPREDPDLAAAAEKILASDQVHLLLGRRIVDVQEAPAAGDSPVAVTDGGERVEADVLVVACGRRPALGGLALSQAGVQVDEQAGGIAVDHQLRSISCRHVFAAGDCAAGSPNDRRAHHAGWTGFMCVRNALLPWFLRGRARHPTVPRVIFTEPEMASIGLSEADCTARFGKRGFLSMQLREAGADRADTDALDRPDGRALESPNLVTLRVRKSDGRVLGCSAVSPAAAEIVNEVGVCLTARLSALTLAKSLHAYPSHGYLLHRLAIAAATSTPWGLLSTCGPVGEVLGRCIGAVAYLVSECLRVLRREPT